MLVGSRWNRQLTRYLLETFQFLSILFLNTGELSVSLVMKQQHPDNIPLLGRFSSLETLKTQEKKIFNETSGYESIIEISSI